MADQQPQHGLRRDVRRRLARLFTPYSGQPPPGLHGTTGPDLLTRIAGMAVPHFVSLVMRLGGDEPPPEFPVLVNRTAVAVVDRQLIAHDDDVVLLTLSALDGSALRPWHPGAHIDLHLPSGRTRQYSLCGDPHNKRQYQIAVRKVAGGGGGSVEIHDFSVGQVIEISCPRNAFMMPLPGYGSCAEKIRFIAGGIGITPILPMVRLAEQLVVPWSLCYSGRNRESLPFVDDVCEFGDKVRVRTDDEYGLPTAGELLDGVDKGTAVYVCGPLPMIQIVCQNISSDSGIEVHAERFSALPVVQGKSFEVELARTGEVVRVGEDHSVLSALREVRPNLSYSCQQGFCGTCIQQVVAGEIEHHDSVLTDEQRERGKMLVCVSRSVGDRLTLDL